MLLKFMLTTVLEHTVLVQNGTEFDGKRVHGAGLLQRFFGSVDLLHRNGFNSDLLLIAHRHSVSCMGSWGFGVCASISQQNQYDVLRNSRGL